jgi:transcriptional regulator with XRE-family HTH domain
MKKLTAAELKARMILAGIKQADLCREFKIPRSTMSQLVAGRMAPTPETRKLQRLLAKRLRIKPAQLPGD